MLQTFKQMLLVKVMFLHMQYDNAIKQKVAECSLKKNKKQLHLDFEKNHKKLYIDKNCIILI